MLIRFATTSEKCYNSSMLDNKKMGIVAKIALFAATIIWGSSFFIFKVALNDAPPCYVLMVRFGIGSILLSLVFIKKFKNLTLDCVWKGALTGVFLALAYISQTIGLEHTTPGKNAFLTAVYCVMVPFMMWAVTKNRPDKFNVISAFLGIIGIGLVSIDGDFSFNFMGDGMTLVGGVFFAIHIIAIAVLGKDKDPMLFTIMQLMSCALVMVIGHFAFETTPESISVPSILGISYLTVIGTALAMFFMNFGIQYTTANTSSLIMSLEAVFGVLFSIIFYKEELTVKIGIGFLIIFIAVVISETKLSFLKKKVKIADATIVSEEITQNNDEKQEENEQPKEEM